MKRSLLKVIVVISAIILFFVCFGFVNDFRNEKTKKELQTVISAIEVFHDKNGRFPEEKKELVPGVLQAMPDTPKEFDIKHHGKYYLVYFTDSVWFGKDGMWHVYWSKDKHWYLSDFTEWPEE